MIFDEFERQLRGENQSEGKPRGGAAAARPRVYLFVGKDAFLKEQARNRLLEKYIETSMREFNVDHVSAKEQSIEIALAQARTAPMLGGHRLIFVAQAEALKEAALAGLKKYVQNPIPTSILVLDAEELDSKTALHKLIAKHGAVVEFTPLRGQMLIRWVDNYIRDHGYSAELAVIQKIVDLTGANLYAVSNELEKIFTYLADSREREITQAIVLELMVRSRQNTIFELTDAMGRKQRKKALQMLQNLIREGEDPLGILAMMARHFRQLLMVKELLKRRASTREIVGQTQIKDFLIDEFVRQAKAFSDEEAVRNFQMIAAADGLFKGAGLHPQTHLEWIICRATR